MVPQHSACFTGTLVVMTVLPDLGRGGIVIKFAVRVEMIARDVARVKRSHDETEAAVKSEETRTKGTGPAETGLIEIGPTETGLIGIGPTETGLIGIGPAETSLIEIGPAETGPTETDLKGRDLIGPTETGLRETGLIGIRTGPAGETR